MAWQPGLLASIRTAFDIDLFDLGDSVWQLEDVASQKKIDPVLLRMFELHSDMLLPFYSRMVRSNTDWYY